MALCPVGSSCPRSAPWPLGRARGACPWCRPARSVPAAGTSGPPPVVPAARSAADAG